MNGQHVKVATPPLREALTHASSSRATANASGGWAVLAQRPAGAAQGPSEAERWRAQQRALGAAPLRGSATRPASLAERGRPTTEERGAPLDEDLEAPTRVMPAPSEEGALEVTTGLRGAIVSVPLTGGRADEPATAELPSTPSTTPSASDPESTRCCPVATTAARPPLPRVPPPDVRVGRCAASPLPRAAVSAARAAVPLPRATIPSTDAEPLRQSALSLVAVLKAASPAQKALLLLLPVAFGALGALGASRLGTSSAEAAPRVPAPLEGATPRVDASAERVDLVAPTSERSLPREPPDAGPAAPRAPSGAAGTAGATEPDGAPRASASQVAARERSSAELAARSPRRAPAAPRGRAPDEAPVTLARQAVDALVAGSRDEAERLYRTLAAAHPEDRALATAAEVLRATPAHD